MGACACVVDQERVCSSTEKPNSFSIATKRSQRTKYRKRSFTTENIGRSFVMSDPIIKIGIEQQSVHDVVTCELPEVIKTQEEQKTGIVLNQEKMSNHGEKEFSKPLISVIPQDFGTQKNQAQRASSSTRDCCQISSVANVENLSAPYKRHRRTGRASFPIIRHSRKVGAFSSEHRRSRSLSMTRSTSDMSDNMLNLPYRKKSGECKPFTLQISELGENGELPSLQSLNQYQALSTGKISSIGANEHQSPDKKCSKSMLCSVLAGGDQAQMLSTSPGNEGEALIDSQEKKKVCKDTRIFQPMWEVKQKDFLTEQNLGELDQSSRNSWNSNSSNGVCSQISNLSTYSSREDRRPSALSMLSNVPSAALSIDAIFETPIVNEISMDRSYLSPKKEIITSFDNCCSSDGSLPADTLKLGDIQVDHAYLKPQTVSQGVDFEYKSAEKKSLHVEKFNTPFAIREASFSSVETIGISLNNIFGTEPNNDPEIDKPGEEPSWFSPLYDIISLVM